MRLACALALLTIICPAADGLTEDAARFALDLKRVWEIERLFVLR